MYLFTSPNDPDTVTAICNWTAFEVPVVSGAVPWYRFVTNGHYDFHFDNDGDGMPEFTYRWTFKHRDGRKDPPPQKANIPPDLQKKLHEKLPGGQLPWGTGPVGHTESALSPVTAPAAPEASGTTRRGTARKSDQTYTLQLVKPGSPVQTLVKDQSTAPWGRDAREKSVAEWSTAGGGKTFAGPIRDPFFWWLPTNVHSIAIQLPKKLLALKGDPQRNPVLGAWTNAYRRVPDAKTGMQKDVQVSRQGLSGFSSAILPIQMRDYYHHFSSPATDYKWKDMIGWLKSGSMGSLFGIAALPVTGVANLAKQTEQMFLYGMARSTGPIKKDLNAHILNKDVDAAEIKPAEMVRLNMLTPHTRTPAHHGVLDGDKQGYPNGRRLTDDTFTAFSRIAVGEPAFTSPLFVTTFLPLSGIAPIPRSRPFPYHEPPW